MWIKSLLKPYLLNPALKPYFEHPEHILRNIQLRLSNGISTKNHVFIIGAPRSGTTLLEVILTAHPSFIGCQTETCFFTWQNLFCNDSFLTCGLSQNDIDDSLASTNNVVQLFDHLINKAFLLNQGRRFVEKTPQHIFHIGSLKKWYPNARFINLYRDGRDCYCSSKEHPEITKYHDIVSFAHRWRRSIQSRCRYQGCSRIIDIKYEELTSKPEEIIRNLMDFLGEQFSPEQIDPSVYGADRRSRLSGFSKLSQSIDSGSQERWKRELSHEETSVFETIAGKELVSLGYQLFKSSPLSMAKE